VDANVPSVAPAHGYVEDVPRTEHVRNQGHGENDRTFNGHSDLVHESRNTENCQGHEKK
jgi:hypothetical protein